MGSSALLTVPLTMPPIAARSSCVSVRSPEAKRRANSSEVAARQAPRPICSPPRPVPWPYRGSGGIPWSVVAWLLRSPKPGCSNLWQFQNLSLRQSRILGDAVIDPCRTIPSDTEALVQVPGIGDAHDGAATDDDFGCLADGRNFTNSAGRLLTCFAPWGIGPGGMPLRSRASSSWPG